MKVAGYAVESRVCGDCAHFLIVATPPPVCKRHLMAVTTGMHVTYPVAKGTCFKEAEKANAEQLQSEPEKTVAQMEVYVLLEVDVDDAEPEKVAMVVGPVQLANLMKSCELSWRGDQLYSRHGTLFYKVMKYTCQ